MVRYEPRPHDAPPRIVGRKPVPVKGGTDGARSSHPRDERIADDCMECSHLVGLLLMDRTDLRRYAARAAFQADEYGAPNAYTMRRIAWCQRRIIELTSALNDHPEHRRGLTD